MSEKKQNIFELVPRKKLGFQPILDIYMMKEFMIPFSVLIIGFTLLFFIGDLFNTLSDFLSTGASFFTTMSYFILKIPFNIRFILPLSILLSCMYTMANLGKNMEITAMRATGISMMRVCGSIFLVGFIVTMVNYWLNEYIIPKTEAAAFFIKEKNKTAGKFVYDEYKMLTYRSPDGTRTWLFEYFDTKGHNRNVILKKYKQQNIKLGGKTKRAKLLLWELKADVAQFIPDKGWTFKNAVLTPYKNFLPGNKQELKVLEKNMDDIPETPKEIANMVKPPENLPAWDVLDLLSRTKSMPPNLYNMYWTIFFHRLAFPWSCFLAVFLGIPLACRNERRGVMTSIIIAVIVIVIYQLTSEAFTVFGKQGYIPPIVAGLAPTFAFIVYGWINVKRQL